MPSGLVAVLMTSFTDTPFFSSCSVLPLSVREVQQNKFFLLASYVLVFFVFQIFSLLPHSCFLGLFCCLRTLASESLLRESRVHAENYTQLYVWVQPQPCTDSTERGPTALSRAAASRGGLNAAQIRTLQNVSLHRSPNGCGPYLACDFRVMKATRP